MEEKKFSSILKQKFIQLRILAQQVQTVGISLKDFRNVTLWEKYRFFENFAKTKFVDNYLYRHSYVCTSKEHALQILRDLGLLREDNISVNLAKMQEMKATNKEYERKIVAVEDFIYKIKDKDYTVITDKILLEKYLEANYRYYTLVQELQKLYDEWLLQGAPYTEKALHGEKHKVLSKWKATPKSKRKEIMYKVAQEEAAERKLKQKEKKKQS